MKKSYAAPNVVTNGSIVFETRTVNPGGPEGSQIPLNAGRLGYDL
jgi:hypothetical protein